MSSWLPGARGKQAVGWADGGTKGQKMNVLSEEYPAERGLTLLFDMNNREQVEALHDSRAAFGKQTDVEPVNESFFALPIWPGHPGCPCDDGA